MFLRKINLATDVIGNLQQSYSAPDTGVANAYIVSLPAVPSLFFGLTITWQALTTSTGPSTLSVNGFGVKSLVHNDGTAISAGDIVAGSIYQTVYDGTKWRITSFIASASFSGTLSGDVTGTTSASVVSKISNVPYVRVIHAVTNGTGGAVTANATFQTRPLSSIAQDTASIASLSGNILTLPAGTYKVHADGIAVGVGNFYHQLFDTDDSVEILRGMTGNCSPAGSISGSNAPIDGEVTFDDVTNIAFRIIVGATNNQSYNLGDNFGLTGITLTFANLEFWKVA